MKNSFLIIGLILLLISCSNEFQCPSCGDTDFLYITDTVEHDIGTPILLKYGESIKAGNYKITVYRDDLILRHTQLMERTLEVCENCNFVLNKHYYTIFYNYKNCKYSTTRYFIEELGTGKVIKEIQNCIGAIIM